jgi:hypothetical protein
MPIVCTCAYWLSARYGKNRSIDREFLGIGLQICTTRADCKSESRSESSVSVRFNALENVLGGLLTGKVHPYVQREPRFCVAQESVKLIAGSQLFSLVLILL